MSPLYMSLAVCCGVISLTWLLSVVTREYSWVDRIWSVVPPIYVGIYAWDTGFSDPRLVLMTAVTALWGARLTFNYARKGGYAPGGEDYRWAILRKRLGPVGFQLFNATFIAPYQNLLIWGFTLSAYLAWQHTDVPLGIVDGLGAAVFLACLLGETVADQQQWTFHQDKHAKLAAGQTVDTPFCTTGLWRLSRHPNFFFEQAQWWVLYAWAAAATGVWLHPALIGPVMLTLLFDGSTRFTESITLSKYPSYALYQASTSRWLPLPPRPIRAPVPVE